MNSRSSKNYKAPCLDKTWEGRADCSHCAIRTEVLFADLLPPTLDNILDPIDQFALTAGATLYEEGGSDDWVYTIRSGLVKLERFLPDGSARIVRLLRRGDVLGMERLVDDNYQHTAISVGNSSVCRIPATVIQRLLGEHPELHQQLMKRWERHLMRADDAITYLSTGQVRQRVLYLLHLLTTTAPTSDNGDFELLSRSDMAAMTGVRLENVSRVISELKHSGGLRQVQGNTYQADPAIFDELSGLS